MEENQKSFKILSDCAEIAESLNNNSTIHSSHIHINVNHRDFRDVLREIEEFVKIKVDLDQTTVSIHISGIEFIFKQANK
tara:strand:- start:943 stop:1182 length:240 start_codon:yes stop_codon:yes gene_type:complete